MSDDCTANQFKPIKPRWHVRMYQRSLGIRADEALNCGGDANKAADEDIPPD
jgi:hypothetical protein